MTNHQTSEDDSPVHGEEQQRSENAGIPLPLIGLGLVICAGIVLAVVLSIFGPDSDEVLQTTNIGGTIDAPYTLDVPQPLSTNILQTKGVADWQLTVSPLIEAREVPSSTDRAFVTFSATAELVRTEQSPVTTLESFEFTVFGGDTGMTYGVSTFDENCTIADQFDDSQLLTEDEAVTGSVCIAIPVEDVTHPDTLIAVRFNLGEVRFFG